MFPINIFILLSLVGISLQINILPDFELDGLIFQQYKAVYAQIKTFHLQYKFDLKPLNFFYEQEKLIIKNCPHQIGIIQIHKYARESLHLNYGSKTNNQLHGNISIEFQHSEMNELEQLQKTFSNTTCNTLKDISDEILRLSKKYDDLTQLDQASFYYIVSEEKLKNDVQTVLRSLGTNFMIPFNYYHRWFSINFWKYTESKRQFLNNTLYIEFDIPIFTKNAITIFEIFPKPIVYESNVYIFDTQMHYFIPYLPFLIYTAENYTQFCHKELNSIFCLQNIHSKRECDNKYIEHNQKNHEFYSECFRQLPHQNTITQIGKRIYFTIFSPIELMITQNGFNFPIRIYQSSKIIEQIDYTINATFFNFSPKDGEKYEIFTGKIDNGFPIAFHMGNEFKKLIIYMVLLLIVNVIILKCCRK